MRDGRKVASLGCDVVKLLAPVMDSQSATKFFVKPKQPAFIHSPRFRLLQYCNIGFIVYDKNADKVRHILHSSKNVIKFV